LLLLALFAFQMKAQWTAVLMNVLVLGCYGFGLGYLVVERRLRMNRAFAGENAGRKARVVAEEL
jgi:hypothetical protein